MKVILLCEDAQHEAFVRRFLDKKGWSKRQITVLKSPPGQQSGEQWVRERFVREVKELRAKPHVVATLVVVTDADTGDPQSRRNQLERHLAEWGMDGRRDDERIAFIIPRRNVETWITYLNGQIVDETTQYPHLIRERDCGNAVSHLVDLCGTDIRLWHLRPPPSLIEACTEYNTRIVAE